MRRFGFPSSAIQSGTKGRKTAILIALVVAVLSIPVIVHAFGTNPPLPYTGAPGGLGTCASCHGTLAGNSVTVTGVPTNYTPGGTAVPMTVHIPSTGGFQLAVLAASNNTQAGTLGAVSGAGDSVSQCLALGGTPSCGAITWSIQYLYSTSETTSWNFSWIPPATNVGNVVVYVTGGTNGTSYSNSYTIAAPVSATLSATPSTLSFNYQIGGAVPATQNITVTTTGTVTYSVASTTTTGGNWLSATPTSGSSSGPVTVSVNPTGLSAGTYNGTVTITASGATGSPKSVPVTLTVTAANTATLSATPSTLSFDY